MKLLFSAFVVNAHHKQGAYFTVKNARMLQNPTALILNAVSFDIKS